MRLFIRLARRRNSISLESNNLTDANLKSPKPPDADEHVNSKKRKSRGSTAAPHPDH